eukprot:s5218_g7.t1
MKTPPRILCRLVRSQVLRVPLRIRAAAALGWARRWWNLRYRYRSATRRRQLRARCLGGLGAFSGDLQLQLGTTQLAHASPSTSGRRTFAAAGGNVELAMPRYADALSSLSSLPRTFGEKKEMDLI